MDDLDQLGPGSAFGHYLGYRLWEVNRVYEPPTQELVRTNEGLQFQTTPADSKLALKSLTQPSYWSPDEPMEGTLADTPHRGPAPGVNAYDSWESFHIYFWLRDMIEVSLDDRHREIFASPVIGEVALWGQIDVHTFGYRAEYGMPTQLICFHPETYAGLLNAGWKNVRIVEPHLSIEQATRCIRIRYIDKAQPAAPDWRDLGNPATDTYRMVQPTVLDIALDIHALRDHVPMELIQQAERKGVLNDASRKGR